jgi:hypothetical protein
VSKYVSIDNCNRSRHHENKWENAIKEAEAEIELLRKQSHRLRHAVQVFKANKRDGVQWPEGKSDAATR